MTFLVIMSEKVANFSMILREIAKITGIGRRQIFTILNWSEKWFREMLKIVFKHKFSVNKNALTYH